MHMQNLIYMDDNCVQTITEKIFVERTKSNIWPQQSG